MSFTYLLLILTISWRGEKLVTSLVAYDRRNRPFSAGTNLRQTSSKCLPMRVAVVGNMISDDAEISCDHQPSFLDQVDLTVENVLSAFRPDENIMELEPSQREALCVARRINSRLQGLSTNGDCRRCWLQQAHCICDQIPPLETDETNTLLRLANVNRMFLVTHHKEIGMVVDTAKILLAAFPVSARLVINGIGCDYQNSMVELMEAFQQKQRKCLVLFPSECAKTVDEIFPREDKWKRQVCEEKRFDLCAKDLGGGVDVVVLDGTWAQARKMYSRHVPLESNGGPIRVCLSEEVIQNLGNKNIIPGAGNQITSNGRQLRRHSIKWKEISTFEATRLFLNDMNRVSRENDLQESSKSILKGAEYLERLSDYLNIANIAATKQLGPPRLKEKV